MLCYYCPERSCKGYVFTRACHSVQRGALRQCMLGYITPLPPGPRADTPGVEEQTPLLDQEQTTPPPQMTTGTNGTHATGMHSC